MRLIDADVFKAYLRGALEQTRRCYPDGGEWAEAVTEEFCRDIDEQPTAQPEPKWIPYKRPDLSEEERIICKQYLEDLDRHRSCNEYKMLVGMLDAPTLGTWIPCGERLPEYNESVLTWDGYVFCIEKRIPYIRDDDGEPIEGDWWVSDEYDEYESEFYPNLRDGAAIAWMPLPEPYQGGGKE